jgi:hypothetical protein
LPLHHSVAAGSFHPIQASDIIQHCANDPTFAAFFRAEQFGIMDHNNNGALSIDELKQGFDSLGLRPSHDAFVPIFRYNDVDRTAAHRVAPQRTALHQVLRPRSRRLCGPIRF